MKRFPVALSIFFALGAIGIAALAADPSQPLIQAHAHNDYEHKRPLFDALDHGFNSVEADIFLVDGKLLVAHNRTDLKPERTLESLYLEPLKTRIEKSQGRVYPGGPPFTLFIDIKTDGPAAYAVLRETLAKYDDVLSGIADGKRTQRAIDVVISGNRPFAEITADKDRHAGIDGRLSDLDSDKPVDLLPIISDNWRLHFKWNGTDSMPEQEREKLRSIVQKAHKSGRRIRFWATPETVALWKELRAADVDLINTDDLAGLEKFLRGE